VLFSGRHAKLAVQCGPHARVVELRTSRCARRCLDNLHTRRGCAYRATGYSEFTARRAKPAVWASTRLHKVRPQGTRASLGSRARCI